MGLKHLTKRSAVLDAIEEFDSLGRADFLAKHGFREARSYFIEYGGNRYDSKAIVGAAYELQHGETLKSADFSGGESTVARHLEGLGFDVSRPTTFPNWSADERMLALNLYLCTRGRLTFDKTTPEAVQLSAEIRSLSVWPEETRADPRFRNPTGVALKLHNFSSLDPDHTGKGMENVGAGDRETWVEWAHRPDELAVAVATIRRHGTSPDAATDTGEDEEYAALEGRVLYREHRRYERDRKLVAKKKVQVLKATGGLACEVCGFDSAEVFGIAGVIDVHHVVPLHRIGESVTTLSDLALVCPTCHRTIHQHTPFVTPTELRKSLRHRKEHSPRVDETRRNKPTSTPHRVEGFTQ